MVTALPLASSRIPAFLAVAAAAPQAPAQTVHWQPAGGPLPVNTVKTLQLVFDDCTPQEVPVPPKVDGLVMQYQGKSSNMSLIDGTYTQSVTLGYAVILQRDGDVDIPAFQVKIGKGTLEVPAAHFRPVASTVLGSSGISISDVANAKLEPSRSEVWAGEVFDLRYSIEVSSSYSPTWGNGAAISWDPSPLVVEEWSQPEPLAPSGSKSGFSNRTRAMAPAAGHVPLKPTSQYVALSVGVTGFGFFQQRQYQQISVPDSPVAIDVRPLPPAPEGFTGAVGSFRIESKVVPRHVNAGEPITWTIVLSGTGNWPAIRGQPSREAPADFQVIQPKAKRTQAPGKLFDGTLSEDVVLIPTNPGTYELKPLEFVYFDPAKGEYATLTAPGATLTVDAAGPAAGSQNAGAGRRRARCAEDLPRQPLDGGEAAGAAVGGPRRSLGSRRRGSGAPSQAHARRRGRGAVRRPGRPLGRARVPQGAGHGPSPPPQGGAAAPSRDPAAAEVGLLGGRDPASPLLAARLRHPLGHRPRGPPSLFAAGSRVVGPVDRGRPPPL